MQVEIGVLGVLALAIATAARCPAPHESNSVSESGASATKSLTSPAHAEARSSHGAWIENAGQWPEGLLFVSSGFRPRVRAESEAIGLELPFERNGMSSVLYLRLALHQQFPRSSIVGLEASHGLHSYLVGNDPNCWHTRVREFNRIRYECLVEGIDLELYHSGEKCEYDLVVQPGADLASVVIRCEGASGLSLDEDGSLVIHTLAGDLVHSPPVTTLVLADGTETPGHVQFRLIDDSAFGFVSARDSCFQEMRIDPVILWSTLVGSGGDDTCMDAEADANGNITVAGITNGFDFPTTPGAVHVPNPFHRGVFVSKFDSSGTLVYSSLIGATGSSAQPRALSLDSQGRATVGGRIVNGPVNDFPTTLGAFDTVVNSLSETSFVLRLAPLGDSLVFSTFIEGNNDECEVNALDVAPSDATVIGGQTYSSSFPTSGGSFQTAYAGNMDGFVLRLNAAGSALEWSTYLGGSLGDWVTALTIDDTEDITIAGFTNSANFPFTAGSYSSSFASQSGTTFVGRLSAQGSALRWATCIGGNGGTSSLPRPWSLALDSLGGVSVVGWTGEPLFPTTPGALFPTAPPLVTGELSFTYLARFDATGSNLIYSTFLGYSVHSRAITSDASGVVTFCGYETANTWPSTPGADSPPFTSADTIIARVNPTGSKLYYSTLVGGAGFQDAFGGGFHGPHRVSVCGESRAGFVTTPNAYDSSFNGGVTDAFIATIDLFLRGIQPLGVVQQTCLGDFVMNATEMPLSGSPTFGLYGSGAPPFSNGWLVLGREAPQPWNLQAASIVVDPAYRFVRIPVTSNYVGFVEAHLPLPTFTPGTTFAAQFVFPNGPGCPGVGAYASSHGVRITVQ